MQGGPLRVRLSGGGRIERAVTAFDGGADQEIGDRGILRQQRAVHVRADHVVDARAFRMVLAVVAGAVLFDGAERLDRKSVV